MSQRAKIRRCFEITALYFSEYAFDLMRDNWAVEQCFPGATVAWDIGRTRDWQDFYLRIREHLRPGSDAVPEDGQDYVLMAVKRRPNGSVERVVTVPTLHYAAVMATYVPSAERWVVIR